MYDCVKNSCKYCKKLHYAHCKTCAAHEAVRANAFARLHGLCMICTISVAWCVEQGEGDARGGRSAWGAYWGAQTARALRSGWLRRETRVRSGAEAKRRESWWAEWSKPIQRAYFLSPSPIGVGECCLFVRSVQYYLRSCKNADRSGTLDLVKREIEAGRSLDSKRTPTG